MPMTRRTVVQTALAGAAVAAGPGKLLAAEKSSAIVIGGGISGMYSALLLMDAGVDVTLLEASDRIGGRIYTARSVQFRPEYGGSGVGRSYARILNLVNRLNLQLRYDPVGPMATSNRIEGQWVRSDQWLSSPVNKMVGEERKLQPGAVANGLMAKYNRLKNLDDWLDPAFADLDISLYELLTKKGHSPAAIHLADVSGFSNDLQSSSMLAMMQDQTRSAFDATFKPEKEGDPPTRRIVGGASTMTDAMAAALGDRVRRGKLVTAIDMSGPKAEVVCLDNSRYKADFVIAAIPFSLLKSVTITPELPVLQAEAVHLLPSAYTSRGFGVIDSNYWEDDGLEPSFFTDEAVRMFWALSLDKDEDKHRCTVVMGGAAAMRIDLLPKEDIIPFVEKEIVRMRPSMAGKFKLNTWYGWGQNPLAHGCRHIFAPGQVTRFAKEMIEPHARLHFAGEHTRRLDYGMESAAESGERAATEVLERI